MFKPNLSSGQIVNRLSRRSEQVGALERGVISIRGNRSVESFVQQVREGSIDPGRKLYKYLCAVAELGVDCESFASPPELFSFYDKIVHSVDRVYGGLFDAANRDVRADIDNTGKTLSGYRSDFDSGASFVPDDKSLTLAFVVQNIDGERVGQRDIVLSGNSDFGFLYLPRPAGVFVKTYIGASPGDGMTFVDVEASTAVTVDAGWNKSWSPVQRSDFVEILALESLDSLNHYIVETLAESCALDVERSVGGN